MIKLEITFETKAELVAFLGGDVKITSDTPSAPRLAAAADAPVIDAKPVEKRGPGRPPKVVKPAIATPVSPEVKAALAANPEPVEPAEAVATTFEDYKTFMTGAYTGGHRGIVLEVLGEYGAAKISEVPADKYDEVMGQVTTRVEAAATA